MALFWSKTEILGQFRVFLFCRLAPEIRALRAKIFFSMVELTRWIGVAVCQ